MSVETRRRHDERTDPDCRPAYRWTADSRLVRTTRCGEGKARGEDEAARWERDA